MNKVAVVTLLLGVCASGASAQNVVLHGADSLREMTEAMLELCDIAPTNLTFIGGGNGSAGARMIAGAQQVAPMTRFLTSGECSSAAPFNNGQAVVHALEAIGILSDDTEPTSCNTLRFQGDMAVSASANGNVTVECPNCVDSDADGVLDTYRFTEWQQALRIVYAGQHAPVSANGCSTALPATVGDSTTGSPSYSKFCDSDVRHTLVSTWGNMFENGCSDGECTALKHAFRSDDVSEATQTFLALLGLPPVTSAPFCNGTEFEDSDPIRRSCDGNGHNTQGENVCRRTPLSKETGIASPTAQQWGVVTAANAPVPASTGDLGLVLPIVLPNVVADQYANNTPCAVSGFGGRFRIAPMPLSVAPPSQQLCPNGTSRALNGCLWPVDAAGNFGCVNAANNRPVGVPGFANTMDGRVYNMTPRRLDGTIPTVRRGTLNRPLLNVAFYRIHQRTLQSNASGTACTQTNAGDQIGCLVHASPCSLGYGSFAADLQDPNKLLALGSPRSVAAGGSAVAATPSTVRRLLDDCATGALDMRYPLSRKLYMSTLVGFDNVSNTPIIGGTPLLTQEAQLSHCWLDRRFVDRAAALAGLVTVSDNACASLALPNPGGPLATPVECDLSDRNPASEIELCPGVVYNQCQGDNGGCGDANYITCTSNPSGPAICTDIDECLLSSGACGDPARFTCSNEYAAAPSCTDIDECLTSNGGCDPLTVCTNSVGSFACGSCPAGYAGTGSTSCTDIDECSGASACDPLTVCTNTPGSYSCGACPSGYTGDGAGGCSDIDECLVTTVCDPLTACSNNAGSYSCGACPTGYTGNGASGCSDIDECLVNNAGCDPRTACINDGGAFHCATCTPAFCDDGNACTADYCDATGSCSHTPVADNTSCDDGSACSQADSCQAGSCVGANPVLCNASDQCHAAGTCDPASGVCSNPVAADGTSCSDGNACTQSDSCVAGSCSAGSAVVCAAVDGCHPSSCNPTSGVCTSVSACDLYGVGAIPGTASDGLNVSPAILEDGVSNNQLSAFGSAIAYTGVGNLYVATPDRGPNNGGDSYTDRYYLFDISLAGGVVSPILTGAATLNQSPSVTFIGLNTQFDATNSPASRRFDPEGVRVSPDGTFYVSDEYGPFVYEFDATGNRIRALSIPSKFLITNPAVEAAELPPANTSGRQANRGMEGLAISPDGSKLFGIMQSPLIQDGGLDAANKRVGRNVRILEIDTSTGATRELLYQLQDKGYGISEILSINDHELLVIERDGNPGTAAAFKRLYKIDISSASDISGVSALPTTGTPAGVTPVVKSLFLDLLSAEYGLAGASFPEKIEGLAFGPDLPDGRHVLLVTNDNDGISAQSSNFYVFAIGAAALPGFVPQQATFEENCDGVSCAPTGLCELAGECNPGTGSCSHASVAAGTAVGTQTPGDCRRAQCDGDGSVVSASDDTDLPNDGLQCTTDRCTSGAAVHDPASAGVPCNQNGGVTCNGTGACVSCLSANDCPGSDTECAARDCVSGTCGFAYAPAGTPTASQVAGFCDRFECNGAGTVLAVVDDSDLPVDGNPCTSDLCTSGVPSNPPRSSGTSCGADQVCDGSGVCVGCVTSADCPGTDTECAFRSCTDGVCGANYAAAGTPGASQTSGDCRRSACDGAGNLTPVADDTDLPVDGNQCTGDTCSAGLPSNPNLAYGTACNQGGGTQCNGSGNCTPLTFRVVRVGSGSGSLSNASTAVFIEERRLDGALIGTLALPTSVNGSNQPCTLSGSATSEGQLSLSQDQRYITLAGYAAVPGVSNIKSTSTSSTNRVVARIDPVGNVNTSTRFNTAFNGDNIRSATSVDGTGFWAAGNGGSGTGVGGVWYIPVGSTGGTLIETAVNNVRVVHIAANGQLYATSGSGNRVNVMTVGTGAPTTASQPVTSLPGMPTDDASPFSFVMLDLNAAVAGNDTVYVADDSSVGSGGGGIQKWTYNGSTWSKVSTFSSVSPGTATASFRGLAGLVTGSNVTLVASTSENTNRLVVFVDTGTGTPTGTAVTTAASNTVFRGVAFSPH